MEKLIDHLEESGYAAGKDMYLDGFTSFTAQVAEVRESTLLVRPDDPWDAETVEVSLEGLETLPALAPGDRVRVTFAGEVREDGLITGVTEIAAAEP